MIALYQQQYTRSVRLHQKLSEKLSDIRGTFPSTYVKVFVPPNKVALIQETTRVCDEIDKLIVQIEIAEEIANDSQALGHMQGRLNLIEEII